MKYKIHIENVTKVFGNNVALSDISLSIIDGKIYSFLGENGAGKSSLMNIISGYYPPTSGQIKINEKAIVNYNPIELNKKGVGMVHQQLSLIDKLSIYDNIILGSKHSIIKKNTKSRDKILKLFLMLELDFDLDSKVRECTVAEKQIIEIIKLLYKDCEILILDEPFSQLSNIETVKLIHIIKELSRNLNKTILFISHDIDEVLDISDFVTVLRKGCLVEIAKNDGFLGSEKLIELMIGQSDFKPSKIYPERTSRLPYLELENVKIFNLLDSKVVLDIEKLQLMKGEIIGIAGVLNNGQREFIDLLMGKSNYKGDIKLFGKTINRTILKNEIRASMIPLNVRENGVFLDLSIHENISYNDVVHADRKFIPRAKNRIYSQNIINKYDVRPNQIDLEAGNLSGGNLQKLVISREIQNTKELLIALNPLSGLDIKYSTRVFYEFARLANKGICVIFQSTNLNHLYTICDRIAVFNKGEMTGILSKSQFNHRAIGNLMLN